MRLVQIQSGGVRKAAMVAEPALRVLREFESVYALVMAAALAGRISLKKLVEEHLSDETLDYEAVYAGKSPWRLLAPLDHPTEAARCLVTGTGLTHIGSARDRQAMHLADASKLTDSMKMFQWGVENGKPAAGDIGIAPEWFYKGTGTILRACGEGLTMPVHAEDGGEEAEIAGLYVISPDGRPIRVGMAAGNEFSDHVFEKKNYLNLAGSKLRECSVGPEILIDGVFDSISGESRIVRNGTVLWSKAVRTGEAEMCHSLRNIEHHHFKFAAHRRPGDVHVHFYGAHSLSFGDGVKCADGDVMEVRWDGFGRALKNPLQQEGGSYSPVTVLDLH